MAQALHDEPAIASRIRVNYIGSSNTTNDPEARGWVYKFMSSQFPELWWIEDGLMARLTHDTFRGMYEGGDQSGEWNARDFVIENIYGRGSTHSGLFEEKCGDAFPWAARFGGGNEVLKEGDSPTMMHLLGPVFGGVGDIDDPSVPGWVVSSGDLSPNGSQTTGPILMRMPRRARRR